MADFPAALPNIPNAGSTLGTTGGASSHLTIHTRLEEEIYAVAARLGVTSVAGMVLAPSVTALGGWLSPASSLSASMVVTRGRLVNGTGSTQPAGSAIAQLGNSQHWPVGGNLSFTSMYGSTVSQLDVNTAGQLVLTADWPNGQVINVGGFVWWL